MAEWEEVEYLLLSWVQYPSTLREIVRYSQEVCEVIIICSDSVSVKSFLESGQVRIKNVSFLHASPNSVWIRDYGPQSVYLHQVDSLVLVDWIYNRPRSRDDHLSEMISKYLDIPLNGTSESPNNLVNIGGNFLTDGMGTGFSSELVIKENSILSPFNPSIKNEVEIDYIMNKYMGIQRYFKMPILPYDRIHHIDMHFKLLDAETLLVGEYPEGTADGPQIEENLKVLLSNLYSPFGTPYKVVRIPMPSHEGFYPDAQWVNYRTYTNSVFINELILVPQYKCKEDSLALAIYRQQFPAHKVIGIDVNQLIQSGGALRCVTQTVGVKRPLQVIHQPFVEISPYQRTVDIEAQIIHASGVASAEVFYTSDANHQYESAHMQLVDPFCNKWIATIPVPEGKKRFSYFIEARARSGKMIRKPITAPRGSWEVKILHSPIFVE